MLAKHGSNSGKNPYPERGDPQESLDEFSRRQSERDTME
jgi:hypothetical protein